jgi:hypothetical protein
MPHEHIIIVLAFASAFILWRRKQYAGIVPRVYIGVYYAVIWLGFYDVDALRTVSRWGFILLFITDILPPVVEWARRTWMPKTL